jgi:hypothetical protein
MKEVDAKWTSEFFNLRFEGLISTGLSYQDAYWHLEEEHFKIFARQRYSCYDSFRLQRRTMIKKKRT